MLTFKISRLDIHVISSKSHCSLVGALVQKSHPAEPWGNISWHCSKREDRRWSAVGRSLHPFVIAEEHVGDIQHAEAWPACGTGHLCSRWEMPTGWEDREHLYSWNSQFPKACQADYALACSHLHEFYASAGNCNMSAVISLRCVLVVCLTSEVPLG